MDPAADEYGENNEEVMHQAAVTIQSKWREFTEAQHRNEAREHNEAAAAAAAMDEEASRELTDDEKREKLLEHCRGLLSEREHILSGNMNYQRLLSKVFSERRNIQDERPEAAASGPDAESKYWVHVARMKDERVAIEGRRFEHEQEIEMANEKHEEFNREAQEYEHSFRQYVKEKAESAVFPRNNKAIPAKRIAQFEEEEDIMYQQVHEARIQYIKLRNKAKKLTGQLKEKEKLSDGLHLIDFEQLKIENTTLNEKIEERNEDLLKLRKKATTTIHTLTHVKEKLEFIKIENGQLQKQVTQLEEQLAGLRDTLAHLKRNRDIFVTENTKMRERMPMIGSEDLLLDYELRKKRIENLRIEVVTLTNQHHDLMQWIAKHQPDLMALQKQTVM